jgi:hypothetical protein
VGPVADGVLDEEATQGRPEISDRSRRASIDSRGSKTRNPGRACKPGIVAPMLLATMSSGAL